MMSRSTHPWEHINEVSDARVICIHSRICRRDVRHDGHGDAGIEAHLVYMDNSLVNGRRIESLGSQEGHREKTSVMPQRSWHGAGSLGICHWRKQRLGIK
jgi:hypothetical protein